MGVARDDVDHAIDGVRSPERAARTANDFDAVQIFDDCVLLVPEHAGKKRRIDDASVHQHQELVSGAAGLIEAPRGNPVCGGVEPGDLEVGRKP